MKLRLLIFLLTCVVLTACNTQTKRIQKAQILYEEGLRLREQRQSEEAAEKFLQGLETLQACEETPEVLQLEGLLCDNLGSMYFKHGLFEGAFEQHQQALACFRQTADSTGMMNAYRNSGRLNTTMTRPSASPL